MCRHAFPIRPQISAMSCGFDRVAASVMSSHSLGLFVISAWVSGGVVCS